MRNGGHGKWVWPWPWVWVWVRLVRACASVLPVCTELERVSCENSTQTAHACGDIVV